MASLFLLKQIIPSFLLANFASNERFLSTQPPKKLKNKQNLQKVVGVFFHYRDVKVVLEELTDIGFPVSKISLISRDCKKYDWHGNVKIDDRFESNLLTLPEALMSLLQSYFHRGRYLTIVSGTQTDVKIASTIFNRRRGHAKVWHF